MEVLKFPLNHSYSSKSIQQWDRLGDTSGDRSWVWWAEKPSKGSPVSSQTFTLRGEASGDVQGGIRRGGCKAVNPSHTHSGVTLLLPCWVWCSFPRAAGNSAHSHSLLGSLFFVLGIFFSVLKCLSTPKIQAALYGNGTTVYIKGLCLLNQIVVKHYLP